MKDREGSTRWVMLLAALVCACSRGGAPAQAAPAAPPVAAPEPAQARPTAAPPAAPAAAVIASETFSADPALRCDLVEVKRVSGGAVRIRYRFVNTSEKTMTTEGKAIHYYFYRWDELLYYVDPAENKKYEFLRDTAGQAIVDHTNDKHFKAGEQTVNWAKFPAPPPTSTKITVHIPGFLPFEDVPVSQ